ncbi:MAG: Gfo/Idh/MocA family oxidoreductase [Chloroflexi bacterium]|nr:Gfo/Idh/MocA family oxidoreductase [Chloroflexota bacterium]
MSSLKHIPGIRPTFPRPPASVQKGIGVLGLHEGRTLLVGLERATRARAVAGCDLSEEKIAAARAARPDLFYTTSYAELLAHPEVEIVAIYTPDALHGEHIVAAFEAGKDVICTKPLVNSADDARRVLAAARRTGRRLLVGQSTRFFEPFLRQRAAFERGEIGRLELVDAHYFHRMDWFYEKSPWAATATDWCFLGLSHPIDLVRWYLGRIAEVHAYGYRSALGERYSLQGCDVYTVSLRAVDGRIGRALGHYGLHELPSARNAIELLLCGTEGTSLAQYHDMRYLHTAADGTQVIEDPLYALRHYYFNSEVHGAHYGEFANYAEHFAGALLDGTPWAPDLEEGLETFCVMEAVRRAAQTGQPVRVAPLLEEIGLAA